MDILHSPQVLKGHDDHVITCLEFSGNRIVSGSDDNTLKVWSALTGKVSKHFIHNFLVSLTFIKYFMNTFSFRV